VNIDIKSAQPLFSTLLLSQRFYEKSSATISLSQFPSIIADLNVSTTKHPAVTLYIMLVKLLQVVEYECFKGYVEMVNSGKFYDLLSQVMYPGKLVKKEDIKIEVYRVFFSKNRSQNPFKTMFKKQFPKVYQVFALYKRAKHTCLSRLLQSIESKLMIQSVSMRIAREKPDLPIFTIHDSIATTIGNEDYVQEVIKQEALTLTGLKVKLGLEYWG
jgi:hypothetical protein